MAPKSLRDAYAAAAEGRHKLICSEAFFERSLESAKVEGSRILSGQRRPTWSFLEAGLKHGNPEPILDYLAALLRLEWRRIPGVPAVLRERAIAKMTELSEQLDWIRDQLKDADETERDQENVVPLRKRR